MIKDIIKKIKLLKNYDDKIILKLIGGVDKINNSTVINDNSTLINEITKTIIYNKILFYLLKKFKEELEKKLAEEKGK